MNLKLDQVNSWKGSNHHLSLTLFVSCRDFLDGSSDVVDDWSIMNHSLTPFFFFPEITTRKKIVAVAKEINWF